METNSTCNIVDGLPPKPEEPQTSDCCGSGCTPCVFDIYEEDVKRWEQQCRAVTEGTVNKLLQSEASGSISRSEFREFRIESISQITSSCWVYRFVIPGGGVLGLKTGQHLILRSDLASSPVITRHYTPVSPINVRGYFDVAIKVYKNGKMSQYVETWKVGDMISWMGPYGEFTYTPNKYSVVCMLAAGTGIAPMIQVIQTVLHNDDDDTRIQLLYSCRTYDDIILKDELDAMQDYWNFNVKYFITKDDINNTHVRYSDTVHYSRINKDILHQQCPSPDESVLFLICGTKSFDKDMINYLSSLGFGTSQYFKF